jgi:hypothetical protein
MKKLDKETLIKHRFWIGLGVFGLFFLLLLILLPAIMGSMASKARGDYKSATDAVTRINRPKDDFANPFWVAPLQKKELVTTKRKGVVWKDAWHTQDDLMTWPGDATAPLDKELKDAYFLDPIKDPGYRRHFAETLYADQWGEFKNAIAPAYYQGGGYEAVLHPITAWEHSPPTSEECWLAQEDLWVKRDLVDIIRNAIDDTARFDPVEVKESPPEGTLAVRRFRSPNWEVTLFLKKEKDGLVISNESTIRNISGDHRRLPLAGVVLRVQQTRGGVSRGAVEILAEGEPLPWGEKPVVITSKKSTRVPEFDAADPLEVWQVLNWYTSPIKRLDRVEIGTKEARSHRFAKTALVAKAAPGSKEEDKASQPGGLTPPGASSDSGGPQYGMGSSPGGPMGGPMKPGGESKGGIDRNRYIDLSDQVRRLPVAMVLVVDQAHIQDVLAAISNSRMRIWTTQYLWQHVRGIQAPSGPAQLRTEAPGRLGGGPGMGNKYGMGSRPPGGVGIPEGVGSRPPGVIGSSPGGPMSPGGMPPGPGTPGIGETAGRPSGFVGDEDDPNLVELVVYGIASLYERFPPKAPAAAQPQTPGAPPSPAGTPPSPAGSPAAPPSPAGTPAAPGEKPMPGETPKAPDGAAPKPPDGTAPKAPDGATPKPPDGTTPKAPDGATPKPPDGTTAKPPDAPTTPPAPSAPGSKP